MEEAAQHQRQKDRPRALHVQASRILCANYRSLETGSKADLAKCLESFQNASFFFGTEFPNSINDIPAVCDKMVKHATGKVKSFFHVCLLGTLEYLHLI